MYTPPLSPMITQSDVSAPAAVSRRSRIVFPAAAPALLGLGASWAFQAWLLWVWLWIDTRPPRWDESLLLQMANAWRAAPWTAGALPC